MFVPSLIWATDGSPSPQRQLAPRRTAQHPALRTCNGNHRSRRSARQREWCRTTKPGVATTPALRHRASGRGYKALPPPSHNAGNRSAPPRPPLAGSKGEWDSCEGGGVQKSTGMLCESPRLTSNMLVTYHCTVHPERFML